MSYPISSKFCIREVQTKTLYCRNVHFETSAPITSLSISMHKTFMDTLGRTTLTLAAINVVDDIRDREVIVTYDYPFTARLRKPLTIFAGVMVIFGVSFIVGNLDVRIGKQKGA